MKSNRAAEQHIASSCTPLPVAKGYTMHAPHKTSLSVPPHRQHRQHSRSVYIYRAPPAAWCLPAAAQGPQAAAARTHGSCFSCCRCLAGAEATCLQRRRCYCCYLRRLLQPPALLLTAGAWAGTPVGCCWPCWLWQTHCTAASTGWTAVPARAGGEPAFLPPAPAPASAAAPQPPPGLLWWT